MPKSTSIAPDEAPDTFAGGFPMLKEAAARANKTKKSSGAGSLNTQGVITGTPPPTTGTPTAISSGATSNLGVKTSSIINPLDALADRFNKDVEEVTLNSIYYPTDQPMLARMIVQFPKSIDDTYQTALTGKGIAGAASTPKLGEVTPSLLSSPTNSLNLGSTGSASGVASAFGGASGASIFGGGTQEAITNVVSNPVFGDTLNSDDFLEVRPNNLLGFDFERKINGIGQFTLTLFDPQWDRIEKKLVANRGFFKFKYGYSDGSPASFSPWYLARTFSYKIDFGMEGNTITLFGKTTGYILGFVKGFDAAGMDGKNISDTVTVIASGLGMVPVIEPTRQVKGHDGLETTDLVNKVTSRDASTRLMYILNDLSRYAVNKEGQGNYVFFIRTKPDGTNELHFHTVQYEEKQQQSTTVTDLGSAGEGVKATAAEAVGVGGKKTPGFTLFRNRNSALIRFTPNWNMSLVQIAGGGGTISTGIDMNTKNAVVVNLDMDTNPQQFDGKNSIVKIPIKDYIPKEEQDPEKLKAFRINQTPERSEDQIKSVAQASFSKPYVGAATATLEIFGTPNFSLLQKIAVFVFKPQGNNGIATSDNIHWISGFFRINKIVDSIRSGKFTTTFNLLTDGRGSVAPDTVKTISAAK